MAEQPSKSQLIGREQINMHIARRAICWKKFVFSRRNTAPSLANSPLQQFKSHFAPQPHFFARPAHREIYNGAVLSRPTRLSPVLPSGYHSLPISISTSKRSIPSATPAHTDTPYSVDRTETRPPGKPEKSHLPSPYRPQQPQPTLILLTRLTTSRETPPPQETSEHE
ncbi:hypothetical protein RRG08_004732 [Elysia crispata]|uniref:Uncharacterized protein n=1 Tax=Elysia crispata TaxID=231223 RepID=A0AAE1AIR8_9GAST|nr:hypothetical protein RRG08_004732 [Elysia crispata]